MTQTPTIALVDDDSALQKVAIEGIRGFNAALFPDHPSGHSCVSSATLNAMRDFFGTDRIAFDIVSSRFPTQPRHYERFSQALHEVVDARVWGGIHFRTADEQGAVLGRKVARWEEKHYFQRVRKHYRHP